MALYRPSPAVYVPPTPPPITGSLTSLSPGTSATLGAPVSSPSSTVITTSPRPLPSSTVSLPPPFASPTLTSEVVEEALTLEGSALLALCVAGSPLCGDEDFWRRKFARDFPGVSFEVPGRSWRQRYEILYQQTRLFPIRRVELEALNSLNASIFGRIPSITTETNPETGEQGVVVSFRKWYQLLNEGVFRGQLDREPVSMWLNGVPVLLSPTLRITQREGLGFLEDLHRQQVYPSYPAAALDNAGLPEIDLGSEGTVMYSEELFRRIFRAFSPRERRAWDQYSYQVAYIARYVDLYDRLPSQALDREILRTQAPALFEALQVQIRLDPRFNPVADLVRETQATGLEGTTVHQLVTEYSQLPGGVAQHARFLADAVLVDFRLSDKIIVPYPSGCIPTSLGYPESASQCIPIGDYQNPEWLLEIETRPLSSPTLLVTPRTPSFRPPSTNTVSLSTQLPPSFGPVSLSTQPPSTLLVTPPTILRTPVVGVEQEIPVPIDNL